MFACRSEAIVMTPTTCRVLVADDHPLMLAGVRLLLSRDANIAIVGEASDGLEALQLATALQPDVVVLDMSMPGLNGVGVARRLHSAGSPSKIIALTVHNEPAYLRQLLEVGMAGYVLKRSAASDLVRAIRAVMAGGIYFDPHISGHLAQTGTHSAHNPTGIGVAELSIREICVLRLTALGHSNREIAAELGIGVKTVETYKTRASEKCGFHGRVDITRYAIGKGWFDDCVGCSAWAVRMLHED